jgi:nitric oxide dioxygenase
MAVLGYVTYIDDLPKLRPAVERIAHKHASLLIQPDQYDLLGKYLIEAIGQVLGEAVSPEIVYAWTNAYQVLAGVFTSRESQLYEENATDSWAGWRKFRIVRKVVESDSDTSFYLSHRATAGRHCRRTCRASRSACRSSFRSLGTYKTGNIT